MAALSKATIDDIDVHGKRVLLREDLNVPMRDGEISDDRRIREAIPTIEALRARSARVIVVAHLGRPKGRIDDSARLGPIAARLEQPARCRRAPRLRRRRRQRAEHGRLAA